MKICVCVIYNRFKFQDFQSFPGTQSDLFEDDIRLVLEENNSNFLTYRIEPDISTLRHTSEALSGFLQSEYEGCHNAIDLEFDDIIKKKTNWL